MTESYTAATRDGSVFVRVAAAGSVVGVQIEPAVMRRPGHEVAARIMACADTAYLEGQDALRRQMAGSGVSPECYDWMPQPAELAAARTYLNTL